MAHLPNPRKNQSSNLENQKSILGPNILYSFVMTLKYLITGATGGLGSQVLSYLIANVPTSEIAAASSNEANRKRFEDQGISFRVVNYDDPPTLEAAFQGVQNLLFVSTNTFDVAKREKQHQSFVDAAKKMKVKHVCLGVAGVP